LNYLKVMKMETAGTLKGNRTTKSVVISLTPEEHEKVKAMAKAKKMTVSQMIRISLKIPRMTG
jgi:hypothetical protein